MPFIVIAIFGAAAAARGEDNEKALSLPPLGPLPPSLPPLLLFSPAAAAYVSLPICRPRAASFLVRYLVHFLSIVSRRSPCFTLPRDIGQDVSSLGWLGYIAKRAKCQLDR